MNENQANLEAMLDDIVRGINQRQSSLQDRRDIIDLIIAIRRLRSAITIMEGTTDSP